MDRTDLQLFLKEKQVGVVVLKQRLSLSEWKYLTKLTRLRCFLPAQPRSYLAETFTLMTEVSVHQTKN
jgi:hypothetical protein